jgi:hypothetical protein
MVPKPPSLILPIYNIMTSIEYKLIHMVENLTTMTNLFLSETVPCASISAKVRRVK